MYELFGFRSMLLKASWEANRLTAKPTSFDTENSKRSGNCASHVPMKDTVQVLYIGDYSNVPKKLRHHEIRMYALFSVFKREAKCVCHYAIPTTFILNERVTLVRGLVWHYLHLYDFSDFRMLQIN